jgi:hypothetical protein
VSEERIIPSAEEFASAASRATYFATNVLQALLVACVVLWVLDIPRQVFDLSLYTEQMLVACLGLTMALAFVVESAGKPTRFEWSGVIASAAICAYIAYRHPTLKDIPPALMASLVLALIWTFIGGRAWAARWFDWTCAAISLAICAYVAIRYEALTAELALLPVDGIAAVPDSALSASSSRWRSISSSARTFPATSKPGRCRRNGWSSMSVSIPTALSARSWLWRC